MKHGMFGGSVLALVAVQLLVAGCGDNSGISGGTISHWDGTTWTLSIHTGGPNSRYLTGVWGSASNDVWAVGLGTIRHWDGARWTVAVQRADESAFSAIWGSGADDVWAAGRELVHWNGATWSPVALPPGVDAVRRGFSPGPGNAWATAAAPGGTGVPAPGLVMKWDGATWRVVWRSDSAAGRGSNPRGISGTGADDVWVVGTQADDDSNVVLRWNGALWSSSTLVGDGLSNVWGASAEDVWAIGAGDRVMHWDGAGWSAGIRLVNDAIDVSGTHGDDVWIVGDFGGGYRWNGTTLSRVPAPEAHGIGCAVWGTGPDNVWVVGGIES